MVSGGLAWERVLERLGVQRLARLGSSVGIAGAGRLRKAELVSALGRELDDALRMEVLLALRTVDLRALAAEHGVRAARRGELAAALARLSRPGSAPSPRGRGARLAEQTDDDEPPPSSMLLELSEEELLVPDRGRFDALAGEPSARHVELLPSRPGEARDALLLELQALLRRDTLRRAVIVTPTARAPVLERLLGDGLDDLVESVARERAATADLDDEMRPPVFIVVLDGERHGLGDSPAGAALAALAKTLPEQVQLRVTPPGRRLHAELFVVEEARDGGGFLTAMVGTAAPAGALPPPPPRRTSGAPPSSEAATRRGSVVETHLCVAGPVSGAPAASLAAWVRRMLGESRALDMTALAGLPARAEVAAKIRYKQGFDTAHELRLKHLAERLCRRGRLGGSFFDPAAIDPPALHQRLALATAAQPWSEGALFCDEHGLGKTVAAGLWLARELRRKRLYTSSEARRALVVAPAGMHAHWRELLVSKLGLRVSGLEREPESQVLLVTAHAVARAAEELAGIELLVVDDAHLCDAEALRALAELRASAEGCVVASATPARADARELRTLAALVAPDLAWPSFAALDGDREGAALFREELRSLGTRARTEIAGPSGEREVVDRFYDLDEVESNAYRELRSMRSDYLRRSGQATAWAFAALEQAMLSSLSAFDAHASETSLGAGAEGIGAPDGSHALLARSRYFRRRVGLVREALRTRAAPDAPPRPKERALAEVLRECAGERVVIFTRWRATRERLANVLAVVGIRAAIETLEEGASLAARRAIVGMLAGAEPGPDPESPAAVLLCTDASAAGLELHALASVLVNYDLPWSPQGIEWRIGRLQRRGARARVVNLAARDPAAKGWTMDSRVLFACRRLFGMADPRGSVHDAVRAMDPLTLEAELAREDARELELAPAPRMEGLDELFAAEPALAVRQTADELAALDADFREAALDFWTRVCGRSQGAPAELTLERLLDRVRQALLQGQVGALCAPGCAPESCRAFTVAVGLRLLLEAAVCDEESDPHDEEWRIEEEQPYLWAVSPEGRLVDWTAFLMGDGLIEAPRERVAQLCGREVADMLRTHKRSLEDGALDAVPCTAFREAAPAAIATRLGVAERHAEAMARARRAELVARWGEAKAARRDRLERRAASLEACAAPVEVLETVREALATLDRRSVRLRHELLVTQLFLVLH